MRTSNQPHSITPSPTSPPHNRLAVYANQLFAPPQEFCFDVGQLLNNLNFASHNLSLCYQTNRPPLVGCALSASSVCVPRRAPIHATTDIDLTALAPSGGRQAYQRSALSPTKHAYVCVCGCGYVYVCTSAEAKRAVISRCAMESGTANCKYFRLRCRRSCAVSHISRANFRLILIVCPFSYSGVTVA